MEVVIPISEARAKLPSLIERASGLSQKIYITVKGKVKAALVNAKDLELMEETLEVLGDPKAIATLRKGKREIRKGKLVSWEEIKAELGL